MSFRNINWEDMDRDQNTIIPNISRSGMINLIRLKIWRGQPLSTIRLGDGEMFVLLDNSPNIKRKVFEHWATPGMSEDEAHAEATKIIITGLKNADAIGLYYYPQILEDVQIHEDLSQAQASERALKTMLGKERYYLPKGKLEEWGVDPTNKIFYDASMTHSFEFGYVESFRNILRGTPIHIISHHVKNFKRNKLNELLNTDITYTWFDPYGKYDAREHLIKSLEKVKEHVVMFGYSCPGKDFGVRLRERGKVVIDAGRLLDAWAGRPRNLTSLGELRGHTMIKEGIPQSDTLFLKGS